MGLNFTKKNVATMAARLEPEYETWIAREKEIKKELKELPGEPLLTEELENLDKLCGEVEGFAAEALEAAYEIIQDRAKFTVVSQIKDPDNKGAKVALGWYATEKQAMEDALKLTISTQTNEEALAWVLKLWHGTPFDYYKNRKDILKVTAGTNSSWRYTEVLRREQWFKDNPEIAPPEDWGLIPWDSETVVCPTCFGTGRIPERGAFSA